MRSWKRAIQAVTAAGIMVSASAAYGQYPMSQRCFTPQFWCWLPVTVPVGSNCYCATPYGPIYGTVR